jgi:pimeloyl-ACP methyl ester carboxylesterase
MSAEPLAPFQLNVPQAELNYLHRRLADARWPEREPVPDWSQGVPIDYVRDLCDYWRNGYNWRATEDRLNRLDQLVTVIDGLPIHFFHVRSPTLDAMPLIMTHGWPGSFFEFEHVMQRLADPRTFGATAERAFHVVVPSLPGYGFSGKPHETGWGIHRIADAWTELMDRLGYHRFLAGGGDWGTSVSTCIALRHPERLIGLHLVPPLVPPPTPTVDELPEPERVALAELKERRKSGSGYSAVHATRPQTIGYSLVDSPVGLCAWMLEKIWAWSDQTGDLYEVLTRDQVLDNITLYWLTGSGASSARLYWESIAEVTTWFTGPIKDAIGVPTGCSVFPREVPRPFRRWAEGRFTNIIHWGEPENGGHFGAWEQPDLFIDEVRAVARALPHG